MNRLIALNSTDDIFPQYRNTPIERLVGYHNWEWPLQTYTGAELLIGMCMDNRKSLRIPDNFAYIIRSGGGSLRHSEFKVSYAIAVGGVRAIALLAHTNCGMVNLRARRDTFIAGLSDAGWQPDWAEQHFDTMAPLFEIGHEIDFVLSEAKRLRDRYPRVQVAPMMYRVEDNRLYLVRE